MQPHMRRHTRIGMHISQTRSEALHHADRQDAINTNYALHLYLTVNAFFIHPNSDGMKTPTWPPVVTPGGFQICTPPHWYLLGDHLQHQADFQDPQSSFSAPAPSVHTPDWRLGPRLPPCGGASSTAFIPNRCLCLFHNKSQQICGETYTSMNVEGMWYCR